MRVAKISVVLVMFALLGAPAHAAVAERVVAVVGERPILLSELRERAKPRLIQATRAMLRRETGIANPIVLVESTAMKETLDAMIDERLVEQQASRAHLTIGIDEVDRAIENKASALRVTQDDLWVEASEQGFSRQDYRDEVRRQLLEGKLLQLRVANRIHVTEEDARAAYRRLVEQLPVEARDKAPRFDVVRERMFDQATEDAVTRERGVWINELRRSTYVDVRL